MTYTTVASRDDLNGLFIPESLDGQEFMITLTTLSDEERETAEFKSLKGIAGKRLDLDDIRKERLGI